MTDGANKDRTMTLYSRIAHLLFSKVISCFGSGSSSLFLYRRHQDVCVCILRKCFYLKCVYGVDPLSHALRRDGHGFALGSFLVCLSHSLSAPSFHPHSQHRWWFTKSPALPCPAGLPGDHGVVSSPRDLWGVVCANGHGAGHRLQQCARLRPQHWCRHGSERYHWCKWGWRASANHIRGSVFSLQANRRGSTLCLPANHVRLSNQLE